MVFLKMVPSLLPVFFVTPLSALPLQALQSWHRSAFLAPRSLSFKLSIIMFVFHVSHRGPFLIFHDVDTDLRAIHIHNTNMYWYLHIDNNMNNAKPYQTTVFSQIFTGTHTSTYFHVVCDCFCATIIVLTTILYSPQILFYLLSSSTEKRLLTHDRIYERKAWKI